jgi:UDP-glucose 4-epimerase
MAGSTVLVTGGAGFIGSHLTETLLNDGYKVVVLDNFSSGKKENIRHVLGNASMSLVKEDLKRPKKLRQVLEDCDVVFHLAANPEVRVGEVDPSTHFEEGVLATFNLLEALRKAETAKTMVFASTSTVYGEAKLVPTPEDYAPLLPISTYGASKLACEALISSYAYMFNHRALILRMANVVGPRSDHGVVVDFIRKIRADPKRLEILGDGHQTKSYLYVSDCVRAIMHLTGVFRKTDERVDVFNVGSGDRVMVKRIANIVSEAMGKPSIEFDFTGGVEGGRGWRGDVKVMQLSIDKLAKTGWKPELSSEQAVRMAAEDLVRKSEIR